MEFRKQKARVKWLREREANTRYYHSIVNDRRRRKSIRHIEMEDGIVYATPVDIQQAAVSFYAHMFSGQRTMDSSTLLE